MQERYRFISHIVAKIPDARLEIRGLLVIGIVRACGRQVLLDDDEYDTPELPAEALEVHISYAGIFCAPNVDAIFSRGRGPWRLSLPKLNIHFHTRGKSKWNFLTGQKRNFMSVNKDICPQLVFVNGSLNVYPVQ